MALMQGDLSNECGFYAVINGFAHLLRLDETAKEKLYAHLLREYDKSRWSLASALQNGTTDNQFRFLINTAKKWASNQEVNVLEAQDRTPSNIKRFLEANQGKERRVVLVALKGEGHWTCIRKVSEGGGRYYFLDSGPGPREWGKVNTAESAFFVSAQV